MLSLRSGHFGCQCVVLCVCQVVILSSMCGLMCLSSYHLVVNLWSCVFVKLSSYRQCVVWCVCQVVILLLVCGLMWLSWCYCESSVPYLEHQKASQKDRQRSLHQKNRPPAIYIIIKSMAKK